MKTRTGFTLIELLAVIVILGVLAIITVPIVSNYVSDSRQKTYAAHETTMMEAAKSLTVECINGTEVCDLPKEGYSKDIYLNELIDKSFSQRLQNPRGDGYCNENLSYVTITKVSGDDYEYSACLYCGDYVSKDTCTPVDVDGDNEAPTCGTIEGQSSEWTNKPRTIFVNCNDTGGSGCTRNRFAKTFKETTVDGEILISDRAGNTKKCPVSVKVDTTAPTCELTASGLTEEAPGWYSGTNIKVSYVSGSRQDANSGIYTYGLGTSTTPDYNRKEEINLTNINGIVTVIGYVKDNAGNEGTCSLNLRLGIQRPDFDIYYGYQIMPTKEKYNLTNASINDVQTSISINNANAKLTFSNMNKYENVKRVIIHTTNNVSNRTSYSLKYDTKTALPLVNEGLKKIVFEIDKGTYSTYEFSLGNAAGTLGISRIELQKVGGSTYTSKNVSVNLIPKIEREKVKTVEFSFDNGSSWQSDYFKSYAPNASGVSNKAKTKNDIEMVSDARSYSISNFDTDAPTIALSLSTTTWTNSNVTITAKVRDTKSGLVQYAFSSNSSIAYASSEWIDITKTTNEVTKTHSVGSNQTVYFHAKDEAGNVSTNSITISVIDKTPPTCTSAASPSGWTNGDVVVTGTCTDIGVSDCAGNSSYTATGEQQGPVNPGQVCDKAGNCVDCPSANVYIDKTAPTCTSASSTTNWTNESVTITGTCKDESGTINSGCHDSFKTITKSESSEQDSSVSPGKVKDKAGNEVTCPGSTVKIDKTAPTCTSASSTTNWTNGTVTITGTCRDESGTINSGCHDSFKTITKDETAQQNTTVSPGKVKDKAGNEVTCPGSTVKIDKTAPTCTPEKTTINSTSGVSASFTCDSNLGGSTTNCPGNVSGVTSTTSYTVTDSAGNSNTCSLTVSNKNQKATKSCSAGGTCADNSFGTHDCNCSKCDGDCNHWKNGDCNHWKNGSCNHWKNGSTCARWNSAPCTSWTSTVSYTTSAGVSGSSTCQTGSTKAAAEAGCNNCVNSACGGGPYCRSSSCSASCSSYGTATCAAYEQVCDGWDQVCDGWEQVCDGWEQVDCNCSQCPNNGTSASVCGCATWGNYGDWSDDASCTATTEVESTDHGTTYKCRKLYY